MFTKGTFLLLIVFMLCISTVSMAQQQEVTGKVIDSVTEEPLPSVNIAIKGTTSGTTTDIDGNYELMVPSSDVTLVFSFVGYKSQEIPLNGRNIINIELEPEAILGENIVVVGYGTQAKRSLTGSVSQIRGEDLRTEGTVTDVDQMLQGRVSGVQVVQSSGEPGGGSSVNIRGTGSINAGSSPLYVIDGLPIDNSVLISGTGNQVASTRSPRNPLSSLNPDDIESIEVLKDASATAIYGSRGANGVILVTTKKGQTGGLQINYNGQIGVSEVQNRLDLLNPQQYMDGINSIIDLGAGDPSERVTQISGGGTDWQDVIFRTSTLQKNNLSFSWGNPNTTYSIVVNSTNQDGVLRGTSFEKYGGRINVTHNTEKLNAGINTNISFIKDEFVPNGFDVNLRGGAINAAKLWDPTASIRNEDGGFFTSGFFDIDNPEAIVTGNDMNGNRARYFGNVFAEYFVLPNLSAKINVGGDMNNEDKLIFKDRTTIIGNSLGGVGTAIEGTQSNWLVEGTVNYTTDFRDHSFDFLGGVTTQKFLTKGSEMSATGFITDATRAFNFGNADRSTLTSDSFKQTNKLQSWLGRINYGYADKYFLTFTVRVDGSSRFGEDNRFGTFPSASVGWSISDESFFEPFKNVVNQFKIRGSWGQTGNQEIGNNQFLTTFSSGFRTSFVLDDQFVTSLNPQRLPNPDLKWETTTQIDIGFDFGLLDDRLSGAFDWFYKDTEDMLLNLPIPASTGFNSRLVNIGSLKNSGFEFAVGTRNVSKQNFSWSSNINLTTLDNEVKDLGPIDRILTGGFGAAPGNVSIIEPGLPLRSFFGWEVIGVWQEDDDFSVVSNNNQPGDFKFRDVNGDGVIDSEDRVVLGDSFPDFQWGFENTLNYKSWQLNFLFTGVLGIQQLNGNLLEQFFPRSGTRVNRFADPFLNRWTPDNPTNDNPSFLNADRQLSFAVNSKTVEDANYIKLQTARISYNLPSSLIEGIARSAQISVTGQNLFTISDYQGFDPALNPNGNANFRIDWNGFPSTRSYVFALNLGF